MHDDALKRGAKLLAAGLVATLAVAVIGSVCPFRAIFESSSRSVGYGLLASRYYYYTESNHRYSQYRCGLPFRALRLEPSFGPDGRYVNGRYVDHAWLVRPIWSGMVLNTLSYAAFFWVIGRLWTNERKWQASQRNECLCGYPIGTSPVCPECGRPVDLYKGTTTH